MDVLTAVMMVVRLPVTIVQVDTMLLEYVSLVIRLVPLVLQDLQVLVAVVLLDII
jgi:hypothetical protein